MDVTDLVSCPTEQWGDRLQKMSTKQLTTAIAKLTPAQISVCVSLMDSSHDLAWQEKLIAAIRGLEHFDQLEGFGMGLSLQQINFIFEKMTTLTPYEQLKLSPLIVGTPQTVFSQFLLSANAEQFQLLKQEAIAEPVQHRLTLLTHEITHQLDIHNEQLSLLEQQINELNPIQIGHAELDVIFNELTRAKNEYGEMLAKISKILSLAWHANRTDLIERLSSTREMYQKNVLIVGLPHYPDFPPSGLFSLLGKKLTSVFGELEGSLGKDALWNDEPAVEALSKFSIWYLKDYWEVGLLPRIHDPLALEDPVDQERFLRDVKENLGKLGLNTVADLKRAGVFSKKSLKEYISYNNFLL